MDGGWSWVFYGFRTSTGNEPVQDWYHSLPQEAKDDAQDILGYMRVRPNHQWLRPAFDQLGDGISEVRFDDALHTYRIYGHFGPARQEYVFLVGAMKKRQVQRHEQRLALSRWNQIVRGEATIHAFEF
jgi:hypothetical protein